jgi:sulfatase maturation enzyme AslB (radical SAM superfamily)
MSKEKLLGSKHFCMMPWVHMHLWPDGKAFPCCIWNSDLPVGSYSEKKSVLDIWNGDQMRELRLNMLNDRPTEGCKRCYLLEEGDNSTITLRKTSMESYSKHWDLVEKTDAEGKLPEVQMKYLDIRFSNLCNLRCQSCGPQLSSSWYEDQIAIYPGYPSAKIVQISPGDKFWNELEPLLLGVEHAYFAGGEPLITDEQYKILDYWVKHSHFDVEMNYTTNFALLQHKQARILDYWKKFKNVSVSASLDDSGPRAEYLRKGTVWSTIVKNREMMIRECPDTYFEITPTISAYNVFHFPEFHLEWIEKGLLPAGNIRLNVLTHQAFMSVRILPLEMKQMIKEKWESYLKKIQTYAWDRGINTWKIDSGYQSLINFMMGGDDTHLIGEFFKRVHEVDKHRNENLFDVYPELKPLWDYHKSAKSGSHK